MGNIMQIVAQAPLLSQNETIPYITTKLARLYLGDIFDILNMLPSESVDIIFADPPYNLSNDGTTCDVPGFFGPI
jgi:16S rRNA G966 N2-methylase RsmD